MNRDAPEEAGDRERRPSYRSPRTKQMRTALWTLVVVVLLLGIYFAVIFVIRSVEPPPPVEVEVRPLPEPQERSPIW